MKFDKDMGALLKCDEWGVRGKCLDPVQPHLMEIDDAVNPIVGKKTISAILANRSDVREKNEETRRHIVRMIRRTRNTRNPLTDTI